jgi:serine/threonine-protein kinase
MSLATGTRVGPYEIDSAIGAGEMGEVHAARDPRRRRPSCLAFAAIGLAGAILGAGLMWFAHPSPPHSAVARVAVPVGPAENLTAGGISPDAPTPGGALTAFTWSSDGQTLIFVGRRGGVQRLYLRRLDAAEARPLEGTDGAQVPAVSLDGRWIAFWARGEIIKAPVAGGPILDIVTALPHVPWGLAWDEDGRLYFGNEAGGISRVAGYGVPKSVTTLGDGEMSHGLPWPLPGGRALLYTVRKRVGSRGGDEIVAQKLSTGERKVVLRDAVDARYVPTGHLVFMRRGRLLAVPFDLDGLEVSGKELPVLDGVAQALTGPVSTDPTGAGQFAIAATGTLAWLPGRVTSNPYHEVVTIDGRAQTSSAPALAYINIVQNWFEEMKAKR